MQKIKNTSHICNVVPNAEFGFIPKISQDVSHFYGLSLFRWVAVFGFNIFNISFKRSFLRAFFFVNILFEEFQNEKNYYESGSI